MELEPVLNTLQLPTHDAEVELPEKETYGGRFDGDGTGSMANKIQTNIEFYKELFANLTKDANPTDLIKMVDDLPQPPPPPPTPYDIPPPDNNDNNDDDNNDGNNYFGLLQDNDEDDEDDEDNDEDDYLEPLEHLPLVDYSLSSEYNPAAPAASQEKNKLPHPIVPAGGSFEEGAIINKQVIKTIGATLAQAAGYFVGYNQKIITPDKLADDAIQYASKAMSAATGMFTNYVTNAFTDIVVDKTLKKPTPEQAEYAKKVAQKEAELEKWNEEYYKRKTEEAQELNTIVNLDVRKRMWKEYEENNRMNIQYTLDRRKAMSKQDHNAELARMEKQMIQRNNDYRAKLQAILRSQKKKKDEL